MHLAAICRVNLLDDDKVERVIRNDESVLPGADDPPGVRQAARARAAALRRAHPGGPPSSASSRPARSSTTWSPTIQHRLGGGPGARHLGAVRRGALRLPRSLRHARPKGATAGRRPRRIPRPTRAR
ncbi:MAG: hypothetical protein MZW92_50635 [Comamonadaceae bacterium]|nr:hypothetical protein [Comamonadaceae bacterium]